MQLIYHCECGRPIVLFAGDLTAVPLGTRLAELLVAADEHDCPLMSSPVPTPKEYPCLSFSIPLA